MTDDPRAGQEAGRLLAAAQEWLRTSAPHLAPVDVDGTPCSCPLCRVVAGVREADPDDVARVVDSAVASLSQVGAQLADLAASVRVQGVTWTDRAGDDRAADDRAGEDDAGEDDAPGYAVDLDDGTVEAADPDDGVDDPGDEDDGDHVDHGEEERTVRRVVVERPEADGA